MKCPDCGGENREGARFCRHCGKAVDLGVAGQETALEQAKEETSSQETGAGLALEEAGSREAGPEEAREAAGGQEAEPAVPAEAGAGQETEPEREMEAAAGQEAAPEQQGLEEQREEVVGQGAEATCVTCLSPVSPGTVLDGRYLVLEVLGEQATEIRYSARDLCRCWQCGYDGNGADDAFCGQCGASLAGGKALVSLLQVPGPEVEPPEGEDMVGCLAEGDDYFLVLLPRAREPEGAAAPAAGLRLVAGRATHPGQVRPLNEDSLLTLVLEGSSLRTQAGESLGWPMLLGLFAVADGMGGHEGGEVASKLALHAFAGEVVRTILSPVVEGRDVPVEDASAMLAHAVETANEAVYLARQKRETDMGTTLTAALVLLGQLLVAHVGDSRALRWSQAGLEQLTADHSLVASLVAAGRVAPEEIYTHPQRSAILRCVGDRPSVVVDTAVLPLGAGDRLVLCSDGLWEMLRNEGIADVLMQERDPQAAADLLVARANAAGGEDNISVVLVQAEPA